MEKNKVIVFECNYEIHLVLGSKYEKLSIKDNCIINL